MRVTKEHADFFKSRIKVSLPKPTVYLFGSRTDDCQKGGDIDILVIGERKLTGQEKRDIKIEFYKKFGEQKIDIVSYENDEQSNFKDILLTEAVEL